MALFTKIETEAIRKELEGKHGNFLITFRNSHGPTALKKLWKELMTELGHAGKCLSWWSGSGTMGILECETDHGLALHGQWALADSTQFVKVLELDDEEVVNMREGFEAGNVTSSAIRVIRIGETGDKD